MRKTLVKSNAGYYYTRPNRVPGWTDNITQARVFRTKKIAEGVVKILKGNRIKAWVEPSETR